MHNILRVTVLLLFYSFPLHLHFAGADSQRESALKKIDFRVLSQLSADGDVEQRAHSHHQASTSNDETSSDTSSTHHTTPTTTVLVMFRNKDIQKSLKERLNRVAASSTLSKSERATEVKNILKQTLQQQQKGVIKNLDGFVVKSSWMFQAIQVERADMATVMTMAEDPMVTQIRPNERLSRTSQDSTAPETIADGVNAFDDELQVDIRLTWGLSKLHVPDAWLEKGAKGKGAILGYIGTGVLASHESLSYNLHNEFAWFDAVFGRNDPYDDIGVGTHVLGTAVGRNGIGIAPEATYRVCKGLFERGNGFYSDIFRCTEWMLCPNEFQNGNPGLEHTGPCHGTPDVIINDWFDAGGRDIYRDGIVALNAVGILNIHPVSVFDSNCGTILYPCDLSDGAMCCAPLGPEDNPLQYSRGPSARVSTIVPHVSCPGQDVLSASNTGDTAYVRRTGNNAAAAHLAGTALLVVGVCPELVSTEIRDIIQSTTNQRFIAVTDQVCGGTTSFEWPNFIMGHGRIRAERAVAKAAEICERKRNQN